jgi:hypothetical protein
MMDGWGSLIDLKIEPPPLLKRNSRFCRVEKWKNEKDKCRKA